MKRAPNQRRLVALGLCLFGCAMAVLPAFAAPELQLDSLNLPAGFSIAIYARGVTNARSMALSPDGVLFVGSQRAGAVYAVLDRDGDFEAEEVTVVAEGLNMPNGVAWRNGSLFVAEVNRILRYDGIEERLENPPEPVVLDVRFPSDRMHGWKFIRFGPDDRLYVPVGAPCNICGIEDPYAALHSIKADGSDLQTYARGIRNTVGFDWDPETGELWFTENGRDMLGNDSPPDELNHAPTPGLHFGYPFCHGDDIEDPKFGKEGACEGRQPPAQKLGPHVAAVGMRFYTGDSFPAEYKNQILLAEHGSWNRSEKSGYRLSRVRVESGKAVAYETFVDGWLQGTQAWGRPVDVLVMPDGSLLVSDDRQGVIYRIRYEG